MIIKRNGKGIWIYRSNANSLLVCFISYRRLIKISTLKINMTIKPRMIQDNMIRI